MKTKDIAPSVLSFLATLGFAIFPFKGVHLEKGTGMMKPYACVIRMHILIFVFAGLHAAKLHRFAIYPVLLFYFFPWGAFFKARKKKSDSKEDDDNDAACQGNVVE